MPRRVGDMPRRQQKAVMAKLKGARKVHATKNYKRYRIRDPDEFKKGSFRTLDIGQPKKHQLIRGKLKKTGKWETQAVIAEKGIKDGMTKEIIEKAKKYSERESRIGEKYKHWRSGKLYHELKAMKKLHTGEYPYDFADEIPIMESILEKRGYPISRSRR